MDSNANPNLNSRQCQDGDSSPNRNSNKSSGLNRVDFAKAHKRWMSFSLQDTADDTIAAPTRQIDDLIFDTFKDNREKVSVAKFIAVLRNMGLKKTDPRLKETMANFVRVQKQFANAAPNSSETHDPYHLQLDRETFKECICENIVVISRAVRNNFVIPDWIEFCYHIEDIFKKCIDNEHGKVATYIPQLARLDPKKWGVAICTIDGQRSSWGDSKESFCLQSVSKPLVYGIALNDLGADIVHQFVGQEPSGRLFNEICLDHNKRPHNPMINAGAIMVTSLIKTELSLADRFDYVFGVCKRLAGNEYVGFHNPTFLSERETADRNYALSYYMREHSCFKPGTNLKETLDLYFQFCSLDVTCESASVIAATLANGGICPITGELILSNRSVRDVLSLMYSCGMYDYSGQFAFRVGLPAKSGVSGATIIVVPNVMGFALWSPPLDELGNSVRGVQFSTELVDRFNFHNYDSLVNSDSKKIDPRRKITETHGQRVVSVLFAAARGDLCSLKRYFLQGIDMQLGDYDCRTALHLAASEGHSDIVRFLVEQCRVTTTATDRWGRTALDDARHFGHQECIRLLKEYEKYPISTTASSSAACVLSRTVLREDSSQENAVPIVNGSLCNGGSDEV